MSFKIFVIDDDPVMSEMIQDFLRKRYDHVQIFLFGTGEEAMTELYRKPEVIILDYHLDSLEANATNGIIILRRIKELLPNVPVLFLSSHENPDVAADTIRYGAYDYIVKNETAFQRMEIMINNATGHLSIKSKLKNQKAFNLVLIILLTAMVLGFFIIMLL
ncbi:MAG: response regulator [Chitinophagales bacterium]